MHYNSNTGDIFYFIIIARNRFLGVSTFNMKNTYIWERYDEIFYFLSLMRAYVLVYSKHHILNVFEIPIVWGRVSY